MTEIRLVAALCDGEGNAVPVWGAWEAGITKAEGDHIHPLVSNVGCLCAKCITLERKIDAAFNPEGERQP